MRINTTAKEVHKELEKLGVYPWQYQDYKLVSLNYNVVISDIETYWNTEARFREGFRVDDEKKEIYVPNFFTKVNGIHNKLEDYKKFVLMLKSAKNTVVIDKEEFPFWDISTKKSDDRKICTTKSEAENRGKEDDFCELTIKNLLKKKFFIYEIEHSTFDELTSSKQKTLFSLIQRILVEKKEEWTEEDMLRFISCCLNLPESIIVTLNNFDYNFDIPKILYTLNTVSESTAMYLWILNELGFDILILEPSGRNTIEKHCDINSISLGYFVSEVEFNKIKTDEEKRIEEEKEKIKAEKEKQRKKKEKKEHFFDTIGFIVEEIQDHFLAFIWYVAAIVLPFLTGFLWWKASGLMMLIIAGGYGIILLVSGFILSDCDCFDDDDMAGRALVASIIFAVILLCSRGIWYMVTDPDFNRSTHTHDGFCEITEDFEEGENGYLIHYRKDAVGQDGYHYAYLYIENNAENTTDMYFVVKYKNKVLYESGKISPMEYCPKISFDSEVDLPIGEHDLLVEFYRYNSNDDVKTESLRYTDELLGTGTIKFHVFDSSKEVKKYKKENNMEYCSD